MAPLTLNMGLGISETPKASSASLTVVSDLFGASDRGAWYDVDLTSAFQENDGTTPADTINDPVAYLTDKSGKGNHAVSPFSSRYMTLVNLTTSYAVRTTDSDYLEVSLTPRTFGEFTICVAVRGAAGGAAGQGTFGLIDTTDRAGTSTFCGLRSSGNNWLMWDGGAVLNSGTQSNLSPIVITITGNATDTANYVMRIDGAVVAGSPNSLTPTTISNCALCITPPILNADETDFYGGIFIDRILTAEEIAFVETWAAEKAGVTLT